MTRRIRVTLGAITLGTAMGLSGVAAWAQATPGGTQAQGAESLDPLKERVLAYWQARIQRNYRAEYDLLEPRARAVLDPEEYGRGRTVEYVAVQLENAERSGNFARVAVRLLVRVQIPALFAKTPGINRTEATVLQDVWVRIGGTWYRTREADASATAPWPTAAD